MASRQQDSFGIDRPPATERVERRVTPPEGGDLYKPIRLPRPFIGAKSVIYDIQDRTVSYSAEELGSRFPRPLGSRRFSSSNLSDLTPPSQAAFARHGAPAHRTRSTQQIHPELATIPRAKQARTALQQQPTEIHYSSELPLRNPSPVLLTRPTATTADEIYQDRPRAETESLESIAESIKQIYKRALFRNSSLMYQRFTFSLTKFPALILVLMALWTIWGRGEGLDKKGFYSTNNRPPRPEYGYVSNELHADIAALVTGGFVLVCQVFLLHQHYNHYNKAKIMSYLYHITMLLAFCGSVVALVFAALSFKDLKKINDKQFLYDCKVAHADPSGLSHQDLCLTRNQRIDYMGVIIGSSSLIILLSIITMITGAIGQSLMKTRLQQEYSKKAAAKAMEEESSLY